MPTDIKISCPKCGGEKHDIILEEINGHKKPIGFRCLESGCGWEGKERKIEWVEVAGSDIPGAYKRKTISQLKSEAEARGDTIRHYGISPPHAKKVLRKRQAQTPKPEVPKVQFVPLDKSLMDTTPVVCPVCEQPVIELWISLHGVIENTSVVDVPTLYMPFESSTVTCSVCGEPIEHARLHDMFNVVSWVSSVFILPPACNNCHVTLDKYSITGDLTFKWKGDCWKCSGDARMNCPGCNVALSIYKSL